MNAAEAIRLGIDSGNMVSMSYLGDLSNEEFLHRPHPGCNPITWQIGHLIASEHQMIEGVVPGSMPDLPEGFADKYTKETAASDDASSFHTKEELLALCETTRAATLAALATQSDEDLEKPSLGIQNLIRQQVCVGRLVGQLDGQEHRLRKREERPGFRRYESQLEAGDAHFRHVWRVSTASFRPILHGVELSSPWDDLRIGPMPEEL